MPTNAPAAAKDLAMPWARRHWAAVDHTTVRGWSDNGAAVKRRPVAGRMSARGGAAPAAALAAGSPARPIRSLGGADAPLFATRVAGHAPPPTGLLPHVVLRPATRAPDRPVVTAIRPAVLTPVTALAALPVLPVAAESALADPSSVRPRRLPVPPARGFIAPPPYQPLAARLRMAAVARWQAWLQFATWGRWPREVERFGWRARVEPAVLASFAVMASAAALIALYSFSSSGMYNPAVPVPGQTNGRPADSPPATVAPGVRAIQKVPGHRSPSTNLPTVAQAYASWPVPSGTPIGSALVTSPAQPGRSSKATRPPAPGGGGGHPAPTHAPSNTPTPSPSPTDSTTTTPTDTTTPPPSDTGSPTDPGPGP